MLELSPEFTNLVPETYRGALTGEQDADQATLDGWARENSRGLIERMPIAVNEDTRLVLATALALATEWQHPFEEGSHGIGGRDHLWLRLDRPFGFVAVHRPTGLPLFVGWAAEDSWAPPS